MLRAKKRQLEDPFMPVTSHPEPGFLKAIKVSHESLDEGPKDIIKRMSLDFKKEHYSTNNSSSSSSSELTDSEMQPSTSSSRGPPPSSAMASTSSQTNAFHQNEEGSKSDDDAHDQSVNVSNANASTLVASSNESFDCRYMSERRENGKYVNITCVSEFGLKFKFESLSSRRQHEIREHRNDFICNSCDSRFKEWNKFKNHVKEFAFNECGHKPHGFTPNDNGYSSCPITGCNQTYEKKPDDRIHTNLGKTYTQDGQQPPQKFNSKARYSHIYQHHLQGKQFWPFICSACLYVHYRKDAMKQHLMSITAEEEDRHEKAVIFDRCKGKVVYIRNLSIQEHTKKVEKGPRGGKKRSFLSIPPAVWAEYDWLPERRMLDRMTNELGFVWWIIPTEYCFPEPTQLRRNECAREDLLREILHEDQCCNPGTLSYNQNTPNVAYIAPQLEDIANFVANVVANTNGEMNPITYIPVPQNEACYNRPLDFFNQNLTNEVNNADLRFTKPGRAKPLLPVYDWSNKQTQTQTLNNFLAPKRPTTLWQGEPADAASIIPGGSPQPEMKKCHSNNNMALHFG